jgi:hypothetical protein
MPPSSSRQAGSLSLLTAHLSPLLLCCLLLFVQCSKHTAEKPPAAATSPYPPWYKPPNERGKVETMDINGDGVQDTIQSDNSSGSGFGSEYYNITNGKTGEKYEIDAEYCFCEIRTEIEIPPVLLEPENLAFKKKMEEILLPRKASTPDPSLQWILQGLEQQRRLKDQKFFDVFIAKGIRWQPIPIQIPDNYYLERYDEKSPVPYAYYLLYGGDKHYLDIKTDTLTERFKDDHIRLLATKHGIVLQKQDQYAWIFVTDIELTGAPDKLRWASIGYMKIVNNVLILNHLSPAMSDDKIYLIDLDTGKCAGIDTERTADINAILGPPEKQIADHPLIREMLEEFRRI